MAYTKTQWVNNTTPINDTNLNKIEQGIYDNSIVADAIADKLNPTDTETYKTAELTEGQITDVIGVSDILIKGQTEQDGTPTPSSPVDVNVVSGSNVISTCNENLFPNSLKYKETNIIMVRGTVTLENDEFVFNATGNDMYWGTASSVGSSFENSYGSLIKIPENAINIYLKCTNTSFNKNYIAFYDNDKKLLSNTSISTSVTIPLNAKYCTFRIGVGNSVSGTTYRTKVMVSTMDKAYTPHQGKELALDLPVENLFDDIVSNSAKSTYQNGIITMPKNTDNNPQLIIFSTTNYKKEKTYTISFDAVSDVNGTEIVLDGQPDSAASSSGYFNDKTFTINTTKARFSITGILANDITGFRFYRTNTRTGFANASITISNIQIEEGSKANVYTPLGTTPIELCKIGNYQDYFYKSGSKWYLHEEIGKAIFNGSEAWSYSVGNLVFYTDALTLSHTNSNLFCNRFSKVANTTSYTNMNTGEIKYDGAGSKRIIIKYTDITSAADFKTWLASNNTKVYYPLETATDTEITDTTLISQLEAIYNAPLYEETNITQENNDLPMVLDITACKDNINGIKAFIRK